VGDLFGLPLHPLVVHAVVVLVPLVTAGMVLAVVSTAWGDRLRLVLAVLATVAAASAFVARASGQSLLARVPGSPEVARHADLADTLPWFLLGSAALVVAWAWARSQRRPATAIGITAALGSAGATIWTVLVGHSGAESVWGGLT
jgi:hypothetical protein